MKVDFFDLIHDLKQPIHLLQSYVGLLEEKNWTGEEREYLSSVRRLVRELDRMVEDLRTLVLETRLPVQALTVTCDWLREEAATYAKAFGRPIRLCCENVNFLTVSPFWERLFRSALENACLHGAPGEILVDVSLKQQGVEVAVRNPAHPILSQKGYGFVAFCHLLEKLGGRLMERAVKEGIYSLVFWLPGEKSPQELD